MMFWLNLTLSKKYGLLAIRITARATCSRTVQVDHAFNVIFSMAIMSPNRVSESPSGTAGPRDHPSSSSDSGRNRPGLSGSGATSESARNLRTRNGNNRVFVSFTRDMTFLLCEMPEYGVGIFLR